MSTPSVLKVSFITEYIQLNKQDNFILYCTCIETTDGKEYEYFLTLQTLYSLNARYSVQACMAAEFNPHMT